MQNTNPEQWLEKMKIRRVQQNDLEFIVYCGMDGHHWLKGLHYPLESAKESI